MNLNRPPAIVRSSSRILLLLALVVSLSAAVRAQVPADAAKTPADKPDRKSVV